MSDPDEIGDVATLDWTVKVGTVLTDATVVLTITQPDGTQIVVNPPTHVSTGKYEHNYLVTMNGLHTYHWLATGAVNASQTGTFTIGGRLARQSDVESNLGRLLTDTESARIDSLLANASRRIRGYCKQDFTAATSTVVLRIVAGSIRLPQRPVTAVTSVNLIGADGTQRFAVPFSWDGLDEIRMFGDYQVINLPELLHDVPATTAEVTYSHGYPTFPQDLVDFTAEMVARVLQAPGTPGVSYQSAGPFAYRVADGYTAGQVTLTAEDKQWLSSRGYRRGITSVGLL